MKLQIDIDDAIADGICTATKFNPDSDVKREEHVRLVVAAQLKQMASVGLMQAARSKVASDVASAKVNVTAEASAAIADVKSDLKKA